MNCTAACLSATFTAERRFTASVFSKRTYVTRKSIWADAVLIQQGILRDKRVLRLENGGTFVYMRHGRNAWKVETRRFLDPAGWSATTSPSAFSSSTFDLYRAAVAMAHL